MQVHSLAFFIRFILYTYTSGIVIIIALIIMDTFLEEKRKKDLLLSVKKAQGMLSKIAKMIEDDLYCAEIAQQVSATI